MSSDVKIRPLCCGYLHSKKPANQRLIKSFSGWTNRLVTVLVDEISSSTDNINVVKVFLGKKEFSLVSKAKNSEKINFDKKTPNRLYLNSNDCIVYRCKSRKEPHAFVLADRSRPLIYLAAKNEVICQHWIKTFRDALWPPDAQQAALKNKMPIYPVSLIDNEYSFQSNLIGIYGYLSFEYSNKLSLHNSQNGLVILDWPLNTISMRLVGESVEESFAIIEKVSLNNENAFSDLNSDWSSSLLNDRSKNLNETSKTLNEKNSSEYNLVLMSCSMNSTTGPGLIIFYTNEAVSLVDEFKIKKQKVLVDLRLKKQKNQLDDNYLTKNDLIKDELKEKFNSTTVKEKENQYDNLIDFADENKNKNEIKFFDDSLNKNKDENIFSFNKSNDVFDLQNDSDDNEEIIYQKEKSNDKKKVVFDDNHIVIETKDDRGNSIIFQDDESFNNFANFDLNSTNKQANYFEDESTEEKVVYRKKLPFYASVDDLDNNYHFNDEVIKLNSSEKISSLDDNFETNSQNESNTGSQSSSETVIRNDLEDDTQNTSEVNLKTILEDGLQSLDFNLKENLNNLEAFYNEVSTEKIKN